MDHVPLMGSVMTPFPHSVSPDATAAEALTLMEQHGIHHLPVMQGDEPLGVVADRDLARARERAGESPRVRDVTVRDAYVVETSMRLDEVLRHLAANRHDCALVTKRGRLAGIFTATDACRLFGEHLRALFPEGGDDAA